MKKAYFTKNRIVLAWSLFFFAAFAIPVTINTLQNTQNNVYKSRVSADTLTSTEFSITTFLHSLGNSGDTLNPDNSTFSNKDPDRTRLNVIINVYNSASQLILSKTGSVSYNEAKGAFMSVVDMGNTLATGDYIIKIKIDGYLTRRIAGIQRVTALTRITLPAVTLVAGDFDNNNTINVLDYNFLMGCYSDIMDPAFCDLRKSAIADISNDGEVNQLDYNLFIREIGVQRGD